VCTAKRTRQAARQRHSTQRNTGSSARFSASLVYLLRWKLSLRGEGSGAALAAVLQQPARVEPLLAATPRRATGTGSGCWRHEEAPAQVCQRKQGAKPAQRHRERPSSVRPAALSRCRLTSRIASLRAPQKATPAPAAPAAARAGVRARCSKEVQNALRAQCG